MTVLVGAAAVLTFFGVLITLAKCADWVIGLFVITVLGYIGFHVLDFIGWLILYPEKWSKYSP